MNMMATAAFRRSIRPLVIIFILTTGVLISARSFFAGMNIDANVLLAGNIILFGVTIFSFYLYTRSLEATSPYVITRMMYGSVLVRLMVCLGTVLLYFIIARQHVNKAGLIGCLVLYVVYTGVEVAILTKKSKQKKNA